jgi:aerobic-type carbon monoxide dehydrogenase small subunit (CoxS/CutS family)
MAQITLSVDSRTHVIEADPDMPLLYALRNDLGLRNPRFGCGLAQCGACTVIMDGQAMRSCVLPVSAATGAVRTLGGLGIEEQAHFCGYCVNGWVMTSVAMLEQDPNVADADIRQGLSGLKCRCGSHTAVLRAVKRAAAAMRA